MADFLQKKQDEIDRRMAELRPKVEEVSRLEAAITALEGIAPSSDGAAARTPRRGRPPRGSSTTTSTAKRRPGRRKGSGKRAAQALTIIREQPGITIPQLAVRMRMKQNYLYRILPPLAQEGAIRKDGRGWHPAASA